MKTIKEIYRIGNGPSSSHTMGPKKAAEMFLSRHPEAKRFKVTLYGKTPTIVKKYLLSCHVQIRLSTMYLSRMLPLKSCGNQKYSCLSTPTP